MNYQPGILDNIPPLARYQFFRLKFGVNPRAALRTLAQSAVEKNTVVGLGQSLLRNLDVDVPGMHKMPEFSETGIETPVSPHALFCWIRGDDRGDLLHKARWTRTALADAFEVDQVVDAFTFSDSRDLTGYEDGTENPQGDDALAAAFVDSKEQGLCHSSFVAVQQWQHDLDAFESLSEQQQNFTFGRDRITNEELDEAPESAHVKRTAQESFSPEAFILRRSMPWATENAEGLMFVAFGHSFAAFEALMHRMVGAEDGIVDALFTISRPVSGSYFWCPPVKDGGLDLTLLE